MMQTYQYDVEILHLLVSPGHAYFGRARDGAADVPTTDADRVELVAAGDGPTQQTVGEDAEQVEGGDEVGDLRDVRHLRS